MSALWVAHNQSLALTYCMPSCWNNWKKVSLKINWILRHLPLDTGSLQQVQDIEFFCKNSGDLDWNKFADVWPELYCKIDP